MSDTSKQEKQDFSKQILEEIRKLPEFKQKVVVWLIRNWDVAEAMYKQETDISDEEIEEKLGKMEAKGDYAGYALYTCLKFFLDEEERKKQRGDIT